MHEAHSNGAASVASQLLAFLKEPARLRPQYLRGLEPLLPGALVFKFAQGKFPQPVARESARDELVALQESALAYIRQVCFWDGATHYQILGLRNDAGRDTIKENYHLLMALIHPDRQDAAHSWPEAHAQRVNRAYAILGDEQSRRDYDAALRLMETGSMFAAETVSRASPPAGRERRRRERAGVRFAKALLILTAVIATLLLLEVWVSDVSNNYSVFQGALTSARTRTAAVLDHPRFLGLTTAHESPLAEPEPRAAPIAPPRASAAPAAVAADLQEIEPSPPPDAAARSSIPELRRSETVAIAQAPAAPSAPAREPAAAVKPAANALSTEAIEVTVARLVGYYEAGETEKLMGLLDSGAAGYWQTQRTRQAYADFFRATRQRKLRVDNLAWQTEDSSARAKGEATVVAEYFDAPGMQERRVNVEMDIALRGGHPRITRLSLFPNAP